MKVTIAGEAAVTPEAHAHMDAHTRQMYDQMPEIVAGDGLSVCLMLTPAADYEAAMGEYELFVRNTSASDGFTNACKQRSNQIRESVVNSRSFAAGETACRTGVQGLTESEFDYSQERFSEYLFFQDDSTVADGRRVKTPNRYDYVYGGRNGQHLCHGQCIGRAPGHDAAGEKPLTRIPRFSCGRRGIF